MTSDLYAHIRQSCTGAMKDMGLWADLEAGFTRLFLDSLPPHTWKRAAGLTPASFLSFPSTEAFLLLVCIPDYSLPSIMWALYSYVPPLIFIGVLVWFISRRTSTALLSILFALVTVSLNELLLKHLKPESRPKDSCVCSLGMPSGHSMVATEFLVWIALETLFPHAKPILAPQSHGEPTNFVSFPIFSSLKTGNFVFRYLHNLGRIFTNTKSRFILLFWAIVLLLPVPISRVVLKYHTTEQAVIGVLLGVTFGVLWFILLAHIATPLGWTHKLFSHHISTTRLKVKHTYRNPNHAPYP